MCIIMLSSHCASSFYILKMVEDIHVVKEFDNVGDPGRITLYCWTFVMEGVSSESEGFTGEKSGSVGSSRKL